MSEKIEFVFVRKGEDVLEVHPTTVSSHVQAGWEVIDNPTEEDKKAAKVTVEKAEKAAEDANAAAAAAKGEEAPKVEHKAPVKK